MATADAAAAEPFRKGGTEFNALRDVTVPPGKAVVVTEFWHHGEINSQGSNLAAYVRNGVQPLPTRVLQLGPGDFCRVAFQTLGGQHAYEIGYGGQAAPALPAWTNRDGLLLETREFAHCNFNDLESIKKAFQTARPLGADYVENIFHSYNPFALKQGPFLSRYTGILHITQAATYGLVTSSRDGSFVVVNGKVTATAPGRHGPVRQAKPDDRFDLRLAPGPHPLEYHHVAGGNEAMMVLAWEINPPEKKPQKLTLLPPDVFRSSVIGRAPSENLSLKSLRGAPDFLLKIDGSAVLPDNDVPLVHVTFKDMTAKALKGKPQWDFGDGQTSELPDPTHVYLRPGLYTVKLVVKRQPANAEIVNRVLIDAPVLTRRDAAASYDDYLPQLAKYTPETLEAGALRQLVAVYEAKAAAVEAASDDPPAAGEPDSEAKGAGRRGRRGEKPDAEPPAKAEPQQQPLARRAEATRWIALAVEAGKAAFVGQSAAQGDDDLARLAEQIGPWARDRLGDSPLALSIWKGAAQRIKTGEMKARCEIEAAGIAINDLLNVAAAKPLLEAAVAHLGSARPGAVLASLHRVRGDYFAATGDGKAARKEYSDAETVLATTRTYIERTAWRGAHNRSTEDFLKTGQIDRAASQIRAWEHDFPAEKVDGQLTLLYARYWAARQKHEQVVALSEQMLTVNKESPYIDQMLILTAESEAARGKPDRAAAVLQSLIKDYRGSPLVARAQQMLAQLEGGGTRNKPPARRPAPVKTQPPR